MANIFVMVNNKKTCEDETIDKLPDDDVTYDPQIAELLLTYVVIGIATPFAIIFVVDRFIFADVRHS